MSNLNQLVELVVELALNETAPEVKTLVGHRFPDDDVLLCLWIAKKYIPKTAKAEVVFVNAGETLPGSDGDPSILHFDTGGGRYDQHGKRLTRTCSAAILAKELGYGDDPGLKALLQMVTAVDNAEALPPTSIHYAIEGYPRQFKNPDGTIDWQKVQERVFELFDIIYGQEKSRAQAREDLYAYGEFRMLPNTLKVATILGRPNLREAAFEKGAAVVIWTHSRGNGRFYVGVQRSRRFPSLRLDGVAAALRFAEAKVRGIKIEGLDLRYVGREGPVDNWFLHDSQGLILSGSRTWTLAADQYTKLSPDQIVALVHQALSVIPEERWRIGSWEESKS